MASQSSETRDQLGRMTLGSQSEDEFDEDPEMEAVLSLPRRQLETGLSKEEEGLLASDLQNINLFPRFSCSGPTSKLHGRTSRSSRRRKGRRFVISNYFQLNLFIYLNLFFSRLSSIRFWMIRHYLMRISWLEFLKPILVWRTSFFIVMKMMKIMMKMMILGTSGIKNASKGGEENKVFENWNVWTMRDRRKQLYSEGNATMREFAKGKLSGKSWRQNRRKIKRFNDRLPQ